MLQNFPSGSSKLDDTIKIHYQLEIAQKFENGENVPKTANEKAHRSKRYTSQYLLLTLLCCEL